MKNKKEKSKKAKLREPKLTKKEKKQLKEFKQIKSEVQSVFGGGSAPKVIRPEDVRKEHLIDSLAHSVILNKKMIQRDDEGLKAWKEEYFQVLSGKIIELIRSHNEGMKFKADELQSEIKKKEEYLNELKTRIKVLEDKKSLITNG